MSKYFKITDTVLDKLGFSEYWDNDGDSGDRVLTFKDGAQLRIVDVDELDDEDYGSGVSPRYRPQWYYFDSSRQYRPKQETKRFSDLDFLHQLWFVVEDLYPANLIEFQNILRDNNMLWGVSMDILVPIRKELNKEL